MSACSSGGTGMALGPRIIPLGQPVPKGGAHPVVGKPYKIAGRWYSPRQVRYYSKVGIASWYGKMFYGRRTADGEIYDMNRLSAAHPTLPLPAYARVTNLNNGRTIVVRVNDRGPYAKNRLIDLSRRAAQVLGFRMQGTAPVRVTYLGPAPLNGNDSYERWFLAQQEQRWARYADASRWRGDLAEASPKLRGNPIVTGSLPEKRPSPLQRPAVAHGQAPAARPYAISYTRLDPAPHGGRQGRGPGRSSYQPSRMASEASGSAGRGGYSIQAGSFLMQSNALNARKRLQMIGAVDIDQVMVRGRLFYRVRVGRFHDRQAAELALSQVARAGYGSAKVVAN